LRININTVQNDKKKRKNFVALKLYLSSQKQQKTFSYDKYNFIFTDNLKT
jgi:hypothetical protein